MAEYGGEGDCAAERLVQPADPPHVREEGARQTPLGVEFDDDATLGDGMSELMHQQLPARLARRVGVDVFKVAQLSLPLQHRAHRRARSLHDMIEEEDRALRQVLAARCALNRSDSGGEGGRSAECAVTVAAPDCDDTVGVAVSCGGRCCGCSCPLGDSSAEAYANSAGEKAVAIMIGAIKGCGGRCGCMYAYLAVWSSTRRDQAQRRRRKSRAQSGATSACCFRVGPHSSRNFLAARLRRSPARPAP